MTDRTWTWLILTSPIYGPVITVAVAVLLIALGV